MKVTVDYTKCTGLGICESIAANIRGLIQKHATWDEALVFATVRRDAARSRTRAAAAHYIGRSSRIACSAT